MELIIIKFLNYRMLINYGDIWKFEEVFMVEKKKKNESHPKIKISNYHFLFRVI